ncbi:MAG: carbohydrate porin, partial [Gammaproteobacteria bacterium]|nr:carbohydrate porin [Gammaproteobacteria bacterium]
MHSYQTKLMTFLGASMLAGAVQAASDNLLGPMGGFREKVNLEMVYTGEYGKNTGGIEDDSTYLDNLDITMTFNDAFGQEGATFFVYFLYNAGDGPSDAIGDAQGASNIDAPTTSKFYELWYETGIGTDNSVKVGLYDLNSEFDAIETAGLFLNSSHGIGPDYAQSGVNGPSIFPTTSFGARLDFNLGDGYFFRFAVLDGVSGDPDDHHGTHIKFESDDGWL